MSEISTWILILTSRQCDVLGVTVSLRHNLVVHPQCRTQKSSYSSCAWNENVFSTDGAVEFHSRFLLCFCSLSWSTLSFSLCLVLSESPQIDGVVVVVQGYS